MAQITAKGFIAKIGELEMVGKKKDIPMVKATIMDNTSQQAVGFQVGFWRGMVEELQKFRVGSRVLVKAMVTDGSYDSKTVKNADGTPKRIYAYNFNAVEIIEDVDVAPSDLDEEFKRKKQAQHSVGCMPGLTPVDDSTPFDEQQVK